MPANAHAWVLRAQGRLSLKPLNEALIDVQESIRLDPANTETLIICAMIWQLQDKDDGPRA